MKEKKYNITETFIVEPTGDSPIVSACTNFYSNNIISCSGNTEILLGEDVITFIGDVYGNNFDVDSISATTFYSGGTNLNDIILNNSIVNGSFNNEKLTLYKSNGSYVEVTGFTNTYTTGTTTINNIVYFNRNDSLSAYTLDLSSLNNDKFITGVTFNNNNLILYRNDGIQLQTLINNFSGLSINGPLISDSISAITISATTLYGDGSNLSGIVSKDTFVTGGTYSNGEAIFINNSGGTFIVSGFSTFDCNDVVNCSEIINLSALTNSNTSNINILSNSLSAYTLNTIFDTYTGNTNSSLNYLQSEIDFLSGATSAYTLNSVFNTYTGNTNTTLNSFQTQLNSLSGVTTIINENKTNVTLTSVAGIETILSTLKIPANTISSGDTLQVDSLFFRTIGTSTIIGRMRISPVITPSPVSSATLLATNNIGNTIQYAPFVRTNIHVDSPTSTKLWGATTAVIQDNANSSNISDLNIDWTIDQYVHITATLITASDSITLHKFKLLK